MIKQVPRNDKNNREKDRKNGVRNYARKHYLLTTGFKGRNHHQPKIIKHLMTGPKGNSEFCFPETVNVTRDMLSSNRKTYLSWEV